MPKTCADWQAVRQTWSICRDFRVTADAHGISLEAVRQRAHRESWKEHADKALATVSKVATVISQPLVLSRPVIDRSEATERMLKHKGVNCRALLIRRGEIVVKGALKRARKDPEKALAEASDIKAEAQTLGIAGAEGFAKERQDDGPGGRLSRDQLDRLISASLARLPEIEAEVKRLQPPEP